MWRPFLGAVCFTVPVGVTVFDVYGFWAQVQGVSMQPTLNPGPDLRKRDYVWLSRWAARTYEFKRGEVVSLTSPRDPNEKLIKRVIGLQGDTVRTLNYKKRYVTVPKGHLWIEGDHRGFTIDSNYFGPVPMGLIKAKATHIVWPRDRRQEIEVIAPSSDRVNCSKFDAVPAHIRDEMEREQAERRTEITHEMEVDSPTERPKCLKASSPLEVLRNNSDAKTP